MAELANKQEEKSISINDIYLKLGSKAKEKGKGVELSLTNVIDLEFTKDFRHMKKGQIIRASELEAEFYKEAGVVKELK